MDPKGWRTRLGINIYESTSCLSVLGFFFLWSVQSFWQFEDGAIIQQGLQRLLGDVKLTNAL